MSLSVWTWSTENLGDDDRFVVVILGDSLVSDRDYSFPYAGGCDTRECLSEYSRESEGGKHILWCAYLNVLTGGIL